jgi:hypothetical protein
MFIHKAKWASYSWATYTGMIGIAISICSIVYGTSSKSD